MTVRRSARFKELLGTDERVKYRVEVLPKARVAIVRKQSQKDHARERKRRANKRLGNATPLRGKDHRHICKKSLFGDGPKSFCACLKKTRIPKIPVPPTPQVEWAVPGGQYFQESQLERYENSKLRRKRFDRKHCPIDLSLDQERSVKNWLDGA